MLAAQGPRRPYPPTPASLNMWARSSRARRQKFPPWDTAALRGDQTMAIKRLDQERFVQILQQHLRPSSPIESFEHLYGREKQLEQIKQAMFSPGRHVFIYGDRGVGKTSLARTAAF